MLIGFSHTRCAGRPRRSGCASSIYLRPYTAAPPILRLDRANRQIDRSPKHGAGRFALIDLARDSAEDERCSALGAFDLQADVEFDGLANSVDLYPGVERFVRARLRVFARRYVKKPIIVHLGLNSQYPGSRWSYPST